MKTGNLNKLIKNIGSGLSDYSGNVRLSIRNMPQCDLSWTICLANGHSYVFGCDSAQWCQWLSPIAPVTSFSDFKPDFYPLLNEIGLERFNDLLVNCGHTVTLPRMECIDEGWHIVLEFIDGDRTLSLVLDNWAHELILSFTSEWRRLPDIDNDFIVPLTVSIGRKLLTVDELLSLEPGDGIVLPSTSDIESGKYLLLLDRTEIKMSVQTDTTTLVDSIDDASDLRVFPYSTEERGIGAVPLNVIAEVGNINFNINELANLEPGMIINESISFYDNVKLTIHGSCIGYARLIKTNDKWVMQLSEIFKSSISSSQNVDVKLDSDICERD